MSADFDLQSVEISEVFEGVAAVLLAPIVLPLASAVNQPLVKNALKEGIAFSERCQEAVADAQERLEDTFAQAQAEVDAERSGQVESDMGREGTLMRQERPSYQRTTGQFSDQSPTETASELKNTVNELNRQIRWLTNDLLDLRLLMSAGLGAFALRQILVRGLRLDEIPWYAAAWYALDTFVKFHPDEEVPQAGQPSKMTTQPTIEVESSREIAE
jgi:hypothetical protein